MAVRGAVLIAAAAATLAGLRAVFRRPSYVPLCSAADTRNVCSFSESYWESRARFRETAAAAGAEMLSQSVLEDFTIDLAVLRPKNGGTGLVMHVCGTHGVEGYAGSAVQLSLLQQYKKDRSWDKNGHPTVVFVHALNPYGMAHFRRWNENNVDLNRNFLRPEGFKEMAERDPNVASYFSYDPFFNPARAPAWSDFITMVPTGAWYILTIGMTAMKRALVAAQYTKPQGIFYGGTELQPSYIVLGQLLKKAALGSATSVTVVDVHTGLGPSGVDTLMYDECEREDAITRDFPIDGEVDPQVKIECTHAVTGGDQAAAGYDLTRGFLSEGVHPTYFPELKADRVQVLVQEFGTIPTVFVAGALVLENQAYHYAPNHQLSWASLTRDAFYVRSEEWKTSIVRRGQLVFKQAVERESH